MSLPFYIMKKESRQNSEREVDVNEGIRKYIKEISEWNRDVK